MKWRRGSRDPIVFREHQQKHQEYLDHIGQLRRKTMESQDATFEFFLFLKDWWQNHITQMDLAYAPYLARKVSRAPEETTD